MNGKYDDIINLPRHISQTHKPMPIPDRAAQFAPFAALTGYDEAVRETSRLTDARRDLDETQKAVLNEKLRILCEYTDKYSEITVTYFVPDKKKSGGEYVTVCGTVRKFDNYECKLILQDGTEILFKDITELDSELFDRFDIE
ncbi:MAG: hypothetical protein Q4G33_01285 [bacterium]|nr:hypothetical protein [bacterium]